MEALPKPQITIGELLRRHRLEAELTQQELAKLIPFSYTTISRVETDKQRVTEAFVDQFIQALHLPQAEQQAIWNVFRATTPSLKDHATVAAPPGPKIYHNLPQPDYGHFIGREEELAQILRILRPYPHSQMHLVTIDGVGGVGKTALALEVAQRYLRDATQFAPDERFEAIIWTSAKQTILRAEGIMRRRQVLRTLDDIYTAIAVALEREDITRARLEEQAEVVRNALIQQRTLLIVDNLETVDDETVITFLRELPAPTKAIVTTRHRIDVAYPVRLVGMTWDEAQVLISQEGHKKDIHLSAGEAHRLYERTGGVPLALVWSIGLMGLGYSVESVLRRLGEPQSDIIRFCFETALSRIQHQPAHHLLMALALFPNDASRETVGHITDLPELDRDDGLVMLEQLSLVNHKGNRFSLLPVTKVLATDELNRQEGLMQTYGQRWVAHLIELLAKPTHALEAEYLFISWNQALLSEGKNILAALEWAYEYGHADDIFNLTWMTSDFLDVQGEWNLLQRLCQRALDLARTLRRPLEIARFVHTLGWYAEQRGDYQTAITAFQEGLDRYQEIDNLEGQAMILQRLSSPIRKLGDFAKAKQLLDEARALAESLGREDLVALVDTNEGKLARDQADWETSWGYFAAVRDWFERQTEQTPRDEQLARSTWGHLAILAYHMGRPQEAKELCIRSLEFFEDFGTKGYMATLKYRLALAEEALAEWAAALAHVTEALDWFDRLGMRPDYEEAQGLLGRLRANKLPHTEG